jgi:hypothetical protein
LGIAGGGPAWKPRRPGLRREKMDTKKLTKLIEALESTGFEIIEVKEKYNPYVRDSGAVSSKYGEKNGIIVLKIIPKDGNN